MLNQKSYFTCLKMSGTYRIRLTMRLPWFFYTGRFLARLLLRIFTDWQVAGMENIPAVGPVLVVANHHDLIDPSVLAASLPPRTIFMAKRELFKGLKGYFVRTFGAFPINRGKVDREALRQAGQVLEQGMMLVMFPEGTRNSGYRLQPVLPGAALIAIQNRVPLLPVGITYTEHFRGLRWLFHRPHISVTIGKPFNLPDASNEVNREELRRFSKIIINQIAATLPVFYRSS